MRGVDSLTPATGDFFRADLEKFYRIDLRTRTPSLRQRVWLWSHHFGLHCVAAYRFHRYARKLARQQPILGAPTLLGAQALSFAVRLVHHVELQADIGPGLYIGHASNIYVGRTRIGRNFSLTHNVTVGVGHQFGDHGVPVIGDDVWIGTGSVIAGAVRVGDGATVAHGSMVSRDVPAGSLVAGNPARVVQNGYDNARLHGDRDGAAPEPPSESDQSLNSASTANG
jgi:serine O-acetyltransferase